MCDLKFKKIDEVFIPDTFNGNLKPLLNKNIITIVGIKTTVGRFLPVSHDGFSNETFIDKIELFNEKRAEFIGKKMKAIERREHMKMFREKLDNYLKDERNKEKLNGVNTWESLFKDKCLIPDSLCIKCWNCSLFGGLQAGQTGTFSRIRYFDTFSIESGDKALATDETDTGSAIGNTVSEDLTSKRGSASFFKYEYVLAGVRFPFITIIEYATKLDVAGLLNAIHLADNHGYGKYSANHGKMQTEILAIADSLPKFSILDFIKNPDLKPEFEGKNIITEKNKIEELKNSYDVEFDSYIQKLLDLKNVKKDNTKKNNNEG